MITKPERIHLEEKDVKALCRHDRVFIDSHMGGAWELSFDAKIEGKYYFDVADVGDCFVMRFTLKECTEQLFIYKSATKKQIKETQIAKIQKGFRILRDWNIEFNDTTRYKGQSTILIEARNAVIYDWGDLTEEPDDYIFHEELHIALRALTIFNNRHSKEYRKAEEELVQDICKVINEGIEC